MTGRGRIPWYLWPFAMLWRLIATVVGLTGRFVAMIVGLVFIVVGVIVSLTVIGAIAASRWRSSGCYCSSKACSRPAAQLATQTRQGGGALRPARAPSRFRCEAMNRRMAGSLSARSRRIISA